MTQEEYKQKRRECWEDFKRNNLDGEVQWQPVSRYDVFCAAFDRAYALGQQDAQLLNNPKQLDAEVGTKDDTKSDTKAPTFTDECKSQCKSPDRLRIAAMVMQGILANQNALTYAMEHFLTPNGRRNRYTAVAESAMAYADALIAEAGKGGTL